MRQSLLFLFFVLLFGCQRSLNDVPLEPSSQEISIEEARSWFEREVLKNNRNLRTQGINVPKKLKWKEAKESKFRDNNSVIIVPVNYETEAFSGIIEDVSQKTKKEAEIIRDRKDYYGTFMQLLIFKDKKGKNSYQLIKFIPTEEYRNRSVKGEIRINDFSGVLIAMNWDNEDFIEGLSYEGGRIKGRIFLTKETKSKSGRLNGDGCQHGIVQTYYPCNFQRLQAGQSSSCYVTLTWEVLDCSGSVTPTAPPSCNGCGGGGNGGIVGGGGVNWGNLVGYELFVESRISSLEINYNISFTPHEKDFFRQNPEAIEVIEDYLRAPSWGRPDLGLIGNAIRNQAGSEFAKDMFERYWLGLGDYTLPANIFAEAVSVAQPTNDTQSKGQKVLNGILCNGYERSFYHNEKFRFAFGTATIYYAQNGNPMGFYDRYDFDSKPWGQGKTTKAEAITRMVRQFSPPNARSFDITYWQ
ncbi:MAG: hypothetical protein ACK4GN_01230 [Runella sp.]